MLFTPPKCCLLGIYSGESQAVGPVPNFPIGAVVMRLASYKIRSALDPAGMDDHDGVLNVLSTGPLDAIIVLRIQPHHSSLAQRVFTSVILLAHLFPPNLKHEHTSDNIQLLFGEHDCDLVNTGVLGLRVSNLKRPQDANVISYSQLRELSAHNTKEMLVQPQFVEKTIGTIINLHEKVLDAKEEVLAAVRVENEFLREALGSLQELYDEDRKTIHTLQEQLKLSQQEVEFMRRKYKLMWNKAIDEHTDK